MPRLDSLLHRPGPMGIVLQHFLVVVRFDHQSVHLPEPLRQHLGGVSEVCDETEAALPGMKGESDRINGVVRDRERFHRDIADGKFRAGLKDSPVPVLIERAVAANRFGRESVAINRN